MEGLLRALAPTARRLKISVDEGAGVLAGGGFKVAVGRDGVCRLTSDDGSIDIEFLCEEADRRLLLRILRGKISPEEAEVLRGITLYDTAYRRMRMAAMFMRGDLTVEDVARILFKRAPRMERERLIMVSEWLRKNGFKHMASEVILKRSLLL